MRRSVNSILVLLLALGVLAPAFAQEQPARQRMSPEERQKLRERWQNMSEEERAAARARLARSAPGRPAGEQQVPRRLIDAQIKQLRTQHAELAKELQAIHQLAKKEQAKETAEQIEKLISKRREQYQERLRALEQRRSRLQSARRDRAGRPVRPAGKKAPDFTLDNYDGKTISLADYKGKIVVLEWVNFECPFSLYHYDKVPTMNNLVKKYKDKGVMWLAINSSKHVPAEANKLNAKKYKVSFPVLSDRPGTVGKAYSATHTPHMYIIDRDGSIVYEGAIDNAPLGKPKADPVNYVDRALAELTSGKAVSMPKTDPYGCTVKY